MATLEVTRNVIEDLLPLYFAAECSGDTARLVESWFAQDPDMAERARRLSGKEREPDARPGPSPEKEKRALRKARLMVGVRMTAMAYGIALTLAPMAMTFDKRGLRWMMLRDNPVQAAVLCAIGIACWIVYAILSRRLRETGA